MVWVCSSVSPGLKDVQLLVHSQGGGGMQRTRDRGEGSVSEVTGAAYRALPADDTHTTVFPSILWLYLHVQCHICL